MQEFRVYRANNAKTGTACKVQFKLDGKGKFPRKLMFLSMAKQTGVDAENNATFGWKDAGLYTNVMLGMPDVTALLAVLEGKKNFVGQDAKKGLYHENAKGNARINFSVNEKGGFWFGTSTQRDSDKAVVKLSLALNVEEGIELRILLETFIRWYYDPSQIQPTGQSQ